MSWFDDQPVATPPTAPEPAPITRATGLPRGAITAALGALLLVGGGVAAVSAASPEPSETPSTQTDDGATTPDASGQPEVRGDRGDCPEKDSSGGSDDGASDSTDDSGSDASASDA